MDKILLIIKGFFIGIAKIIPGVSGAVLAIMFGLYDKGINAITNFFNNKKENFYFLLCVGLGIAIAIVLGSNIIVYFLQNYKFITLMFFLGLMLPMVFPLYKSCGKGIKNYIFILLGMLFTYCFTIISNFSFDLVGDNEIINFILFFVGGMVDALAMIFPGISGTILLIFLGLYEKVMTSIGNVLNLSLLSYNIKILFPYGLGMIVGIVIFSLLINYLFKNYRNNTYSFIFGISVTSIWFLMKMTFYLRYSLMDLGLGIVLFFIGIFVASKLDS